MQEFVHSMASVRVVFGLNAWSKLKEEVMLLNAKNVLLVCTPRQRWLAEKALAELDGLAAAVYDQSVMHVPSENVADLERFAKQHGADGIVAIGGGSSIGMGKALALSTSLPILAVPTTYSGSEMTSVYGITADGIKKTGKSPRVLPRTVIYDPALTMNLPLDVSVASGLNAIAHAAEGLYAKESNPLLSLMAEEGIRCVAQGLRGLVQRQEDLEARYDCLYGAWLCGTVLANAGMALHHKLCHTLGGSFNMPHAQTHAVILPHAMAYNAPAAGAAMARISRALQRPGQSAATALHDLASELNAPLALRDIGMDIGNIERATDLAVMTPYWNPSPIERNGVRTLLYAAYEGLRPV